MKDEELESCIKKALRISLIVGTYSPFSFSKDIPGQIGIVFNSEYVDDYLRFSNYMLEEYKDFRKSVYLSQVDASIMDFTLMIDKEPSTILSVRGLTCNPAQVEMFFKNQKKDKPLLLFPHLIRTHDVFSAVADEIPEMAAISPVHIHSWEGKACNKKEPLETSAQSI